MKKINPKLLEPEDVHDMKCTYHRGQLGQDLLAREEIEAPRFHRTAGTGTRREGARVPGLSSLPFRHGRGLSGRRGRRAGGRRVLPLGAGQRPILPHLGEGLQEARGAPVPMD